MASPSVRIIKKMNRLPPMPARVRRDVERETHAAGFRIETKAKGRSRVDTGQQRNEVFNQPGSMSTRAGAAAAHSIFNDQGTRYIPADHFFSDPAQEEARDWPNKVKSVVARALV